MTDGAPERIIAGSVADMSPRLVARVLSIGRAALGVALVAVPDRVTGPWVGSTTEPVRVLARGLGARDVGLGAGMLVALARGGDARRWAAAATLADGVDALASAAAGDRIPPAGRWGTVALAAGSALAGAWLTRAL
jgi:hypothetical protein